MYLYTIIYTNYHIHMSSTRVDFSAEVLHKRVTEMRMRHARVSYERLAFGSVASQPTSSNQPTVSGFPIVTQRNQCAGIVR